MGGNCWLERNPLETGLLLILTVSVPFLLTMIVAYFVLLSHNCPDCSIKCDEFCKNATMRTLNASNISGIVPSLFQLNPNISLSKLAEKHEICPDNLLSKIQFKTDHCTHVASILEDVYADDVTEQRYLCAATVITFKWVLSSAWCVKEEHQISTAAYRAFVRAGSIHWMKGGSEHEIKSVVFADADTQFTLAALELHEEFPKLPSIRPARLSLTSLYSNKAIADMYGWKSNDSVLPMKFRKKYVDMTSETVILYKDDQCIMFTANMPNLFCALATTSENKICTFLKGSPVVRGNILVGINVGGYCYRDNKKLAHYIYDISKALNWLQNITGVYVEHA